MTQDGNSVKERWERAEQAAKVLGYTKANVFNAGVEMDKLIPMILDGDKDAIEQAKALPFYAKGQNTKTKKPKTKTKAKQNDLAVMIWAIKKVGLENAEQVFQHAKNLVKSQKKK